MTASSYKFDDGQSYLSKCFPARTILSRRKEGAGHWLVAHRKAVEQKQRNMHTKNKVTNKESEIREESCITDPPPGNTLDGTFLMRLHCVDKPSELCSVDISEQQLNSVKHEDFKEFDNVAYISASVNLLSLGSFSSFVSLRELDLSLNRLSSMTFDAADFPHLEVLDLSYNSLSADDIVSISRLSQLKVLHLSGNQLHHLPLGSSERDPTHLPAEEEEETPFKALKALMLDDNKLSSDVFNSLSNLKRLQYLNLQGNHISEIPFMEPRESSKHLQNSVEQQTDEERLAQTEQNLNPDKNFKKVSQLGSPRSLSHTCDMENNKRLSLPLPELQFLNLANNKIAEEETLLAVALFPMLSEINIQSNPLTTQRSGDLPLLTYYLQERLGITIKCKKTPEVVKLPLTASTRPNWKVEEKIPKGLTKPSLTEASSVSVELTRSLCKNVMSGCRSVAQTEGNVTPAPQAEARNGGEEIFQHPNAFFVTQTTDVPDYELDLQPEETETAENNKRIKDDGIPEKCEYYKMTDEKPNPDVVEPIRIQTAVSMLEHKLKNFTVYRDSKPKPGDIQTPYRERDKRIKELHPMNSKQKPNERIDKTLKQIKESSTLREISLSSALNDTDVNRQEYKEALSLLKDMKRKYKIILKETMEQVARNESERSNKQTETD
ncbi:hypothetical protein LDENG_00109980 [Lucifuga dentata]|nr:hypothetical protein LDENG_00109980 [Lucifuga dentata]